MLFQICVNLRGNEFSMAQIDESGAPLRENGEKQPLGSSQKFNFQRDSASKKCVVSVFDLESSKSTEAKKTRHSRLHAIILLSIEEHSQVVKVVNNMVLLWPLFPFPPKCWQVKEWLSTLQRMCRQVACLMVTGNLSRDLGGVIPSPEGKRSMIKIFGHEWRGPLVHPIAPVGLHNLPQRTAETTTK